MLSMDSDSDLEEYLVSLLGEDSSKVFLRELVPRWKPSRALAGDDDLMTPLVRLKQDELVLFAEKKQKSKGKDKKVLKTQLTTSHVKFIHRRVKVFFSLHQAYLLVMGLTTPPLLNHHLDQPLNLHPHQSPLRRHSLTVKLSPAAIAPRPRLKLDLFLS